MQEYFLWQRDKKIGFQLPTSWQVLNNIVSQPETTQKTVTQMVSRSIADPIGTPPLEKVVKPTDKVVIIVDDFARPTPKKEMLTCLTDHLVRFGVAYHQIDILFGIGTHRPLSEHEVEVAMGRELLKKIRYTMHDSRSKKLVSIGKLRTGGEIKIHPLLTEANVRIGIGSIIPHPMNGFGGGGKIILPGVCSYDTIREHHWTHALTKGACIGNIIDNSFYEEICEAARLANLDFIINAVYNSRAEVKEVVSGHFKKAHQFGIDLSLKEFSVNIDQDADVSIVSAFPMEEGPQVTKPMGTATKVTKKGGVVILVASVPAGIPETYLQTFDVAYQLAKGNPKRLALESLQGGMPIIDNAPLDFNVALAVTLLYLSRVNVIMVSKEVSKDQAGRLGFKHVDSLDEAIQLAYRSFPQAKVNIFSAGGLTVPLFKKDFCFD
jgi:nickel-dependent lactate racemase